ncbi:hypothetical protein [Microviridae sp.]|nr:hypothetical protein [Microviridae sp.]UOF82363.1 hypothetical protein [Microviridae sp.]
MGKKSKYIQATFKGERDIKKTRITFNPTASPSGRVFY